MTQHNGRPGEPRWDNSATDTHACRLATSSVSGDEIILNFGTVRGDGQPGGELAAQLVRRIAVQPMLVKHLHAMLGKMLAEHDARAAPSRPAG